MLIDHPNFSKIQFYIYISFKFFFLVFFFLPFFWPYDSKCFIAPSYCLCMIYNKINVFSGLKGGASRGGCRRRCQTLHIKYIFPRKIPCGAPDGYPLLLIQEVHSYYGSGVRAVNVLCNLEYQCLSHTILCAINIYYIWSVIDV